MKIITYSLRAGAARSDQYYRDIAALTDEVLAEADTRVRLLLDAYSAQAADEVPRTRPEYVLDLLTLGVLWRVYLGRALHLTGRPQRVLTGLARLRRQVDFLKPGIDRLRGVLSALFLGSNGHLPELEPPTLAQFGQLLGWLTAAGDFDEEVQRLARWQAFLQSLSPDEAASHLITTLTFAARFESRSESMLGRYTRNVEAFLADTHPAYRWREDNIFCGRQRVEYHLNMLGTEILNRALRSLFLGTVRKVVLVPPCMRAQPQEKCQAQATTFGARCAACTPGCRIHQLTRLGEKHGFGVLILPDDVRVFSGKAAGQENTVGIVGVSCAATNVSGGWKTRRSGIPAQGVLLDYCGCGWHWDATGFPTDINIRQLLTVLDRPVSESLTESHSA